MASETAARRPRMVRNADLKSLLETFLVSAAASFLGIRLYLALTGYPQIGGHGFHIAHVLWGGLLMLVALVLLIAFLGGHVRVIAAVLGGVGFGAFIDELGKFITSDVNYFFRPAIALIYAIFLILYLVFQAIERRRQSTSRANLARALDATTTAVVSGFVQDDRQRALDLIAATDAGDPIASAIRDGLEATPASTGPAPWVGVRFVRWLRCRYELVIQEQMFISFVVVVMPVSAATSIVSLVSEVVRDPAFGQGDLALSFGDWLKIVATVVGIGFTAIGLVALRKSRLIAYEWLKRAVLVSLLFTQFVSFYEAQLSAAWALLFNLTLFAALNFAIRREQALATGAGIEPSAPVAERAAA